MKRLKGEGLDFSKGRTHMSLPAEEGTVQIFMSYMAWQC